jgi:ribonuclease J
MTTDFKDFNPDALYFAPLGGCGEFGGNFSVYTCGGRWLAIDLGVGFAEDDLPGIDLVLPDPKAILPYKDKLEGLIITHSHLDHIGALPHLWPRLGCPVYMTEFAHELLLTMLAGMEDAPNIPVTVIDPGTRFKLGPFDCSLVPITHSVPEACMVEIITPKGRVVHTGDWKLDPEPLVGQPYIPEYFSQMGQDGVLAVVGDSTNALVPGRSKSEADVCDGLTALFAGLEGRIIVTCMSSNVGRVFSVAEAALAAGRQVALSGWSLARFERIARDLGYFHELPPFVKRKSIGNMMRDDLVVICTGSQGETNASLYKLALGRHPDFELAPGDNVVFSALAIPGNEVEIADIQEMLRAQGVNVITRHSTETCVYASSHPAADELAEMYSHLKPKVLVAVHGEKPMQEANASVGHRAGAQITFTPENGDVIELSAQPQAKCVGKLTTAQLALEGLSLVPTTAEHLVERRKLHYSGSVMITLALMADGKQHTPAQISLMGLEDGARDLVDRALEKVFSNEHPSALKQDKVVVEAVRLAVRRSINHVYGRKPVTDVHIVRV